MKTPVKVLLVTLLVGVPAFVLGPVLWPPAAGIPEPTAAQLALFILLAAIEALLFGLGVAFVLFGLPLVRRAAPDSPGWAWAAFASLAWLLLSWWPHDNLHIANGTDLGGLLAIEYGFHLTVIICAVILAGFFVRTLRGRPVTA